MLPQVEELATVVVCEDDDPTRELLCDQLTADRYRALPAPSASDALRLCGYNHPDVMLLDLGLPDASGIDVLREIRTSGERFDPDLPVLVLSGRSSEADRLRGFEAGADDFVQKPFHYPELLAAIPEGGVGDTCPEFSLGVQLGRSSSVTHISTRRALRKRLACRRGAGIGSAHRQPSKEARGPTARPSRRKRRRVAYDRRTDL
jgi:CheY-like chemotaxis protein